MTELIKLQETLKQVLVNAQLTRQVLPDCGGLQLYLLDEHYSIVDLADDTAVKVMDNPLYWLFCWASGVVMAQQILAGNINVAGKTVLDVGSGSGVVAIAAAMAGAKKVIASDIDPVSQLAIKANGELNKVDIKIIGDFNDYFSMYDGDDQVDVITVADVLYDRNNIPLIDVLMKKSQQLILADSRVKNFSYPGLEHRDALAGETLPNLGGFDEFKTVNIFYKTEIR